MALTYCDGSRSKFKGATLHNSTSSTQYNINDIVYTQSGSTKTYYRCIKNCTGSISLSNTEYWESISSDYPIDNLVEMFELSATDAVNVQRWKVLKAKDNKTAEEISEFESLTTALAQRIVTSEDWNTLCDCIINLQKMYVNKGLNEIQTTVEDYVENYAQTDINSKLGTIINSLLLTNATQIIISETAPTVINGALWIKPKTI